MIDDFGHTPMQKKLWALTILHGDLMERNWLFPVAMLP
jgi:hypothetical protein